jgi:hypothetical protein
VSLVTIIFLTGKINWTTEEKRVDKNPLYIHKNMINFPYFGIEIIPHFLFNIVYNVRAEYNKMRKVGSII